MILNAKALGGDDSIVIRVERRFAETLWLLPISAAFRAAAHDRNRVFRKRADPLTTSVSDMPALPAAGWTHRPARRGGSRIHTSYRSAATDGLSCL